MITARDIKIRRPPKGCYKIVCVRTRVLAVYENGRVWNIQRGCWYKAEVDKNGYKTLHWMKVHRLVLFVFKGRPNRRAGHTEGRHLDGNSGNNHYKNLRWGTPLQNWQDRRTHGRGMRSPSAIRKQRDSILRYYRNQRKTI